MRRFLGLKGECVRLFSAKALSSRVLSAEEVRRDRAGCRKIGPCGIGEKALYLNGFYLERRYYIPYSAVSRVFKRVAMSKGGFTGKGLFATLSYLVVVYDGGKEKVCLFRTEESVDEFLDVIRERYPEIRTLSEMAERKLEDRRRRELARPKPVLTAGAEMERDRLAAARTYLERRPELYRALSHAARAKRVNERSNPAYRWVALAIVILGIGSAAYGVWSWLTDAGSGLYFALFGLAAVFLFSGANVLPTRRNNKNYVDGQWDQACVEMEGYLRQYRGTFPVPARYAHPVTLARMERVIRDGRAQQADEALNLVKKDLKALNADVSVEQEEYDEIMAIKPMFLISDYQ